MANRTRLFYSSLLRILVAWLVLNYSTSTVCLYTVVLGYWWNQTCSRFCFCVLRATRLFRQFPRISRWSICFTFDLTTCLNTIWRPKWARSFQFPSNMSYILWTRTIKHHRRWGKWRHCTTKLTSTTATLLFERKLVVLNPNFAFEYKFLATDIIYLQVIVTTSN